MGKGKNGLPDRWEIYKPVVSHVAGTRFLPFKVPLREEILMRVPNRSEWFTPALLCEMKPQLKAIIDLTDTFRYYNPEEFTSRGVSHIKINITGQGKIPSRDKLRQFFKAVDEFTDALPEDALIGVHCTHGLNRTGYLICKYMVTRMKIDADEAITRFEKARGHEMERQNFISDIKGNELERTSKKNAKPQRRQMYHREQPSSRPSESNWRSEPRAEPTGQGHSRSSGNHAGAETATQKTTKKTHHRSQGGSSNDHSIGPDLCHDDDHRRSNNRSRRNQQ